MSAVRNKNNKSTEIAFISLLRKNKITRWRRYYPIIRILDFVFPKGKNVVLIDGCFWHKYPKCYRKTKIKQSILGPESGIQQKENILAQISMAYCVLEQELNGSSISVIKKCVDLKEINPQPYWGFDATRPNEMTGFCGNDENTTPF